MASVATNDNTPAVEGGAIKRVSKLPYPGKFEDINRIASEVLSPQDAFDGFKCEVSGMSSNQFQFSHAFHMGQSEETPKYALTTVFSDETNPPTAIGKVDSDGKVFGRFITATLGGRMFISGTVNINKDFQTYLGGEIEHKHPTQNIVVKYDANNTFAAGYIRSITKRWAGGLEITRSPAQRLFMYTLGVRYNRGPNSYVFTANNYAQAAMTYSFKKANAELATELQMMLGQTGLASKLSVGLRYGFTQQVFKIRADTEGTVVGMYEEKLTPSFRISFCSTLNYFTNDFKFGIGLSISR
ncbi:translocase of outer mitochondrial membrane [Heterostelium album PN500]|uniref:Translocase of outer mitochondrial membrane n=1 Tax=Heterostelium pallidum (strain ATCC 26659 / Pp 5 / PN500) TaxID=670386 RepID=D3BDZ5_HETP5|nr:translocase of outer mitochondrial membrane [Heterostelium album PN500]EFA80126.1 translocase of outer mitochondrial membrane [Heterostelium album PN500]|eukprot:XP_020432246.1 translocase of outer mitochondrial membrane [Heterostelium album PN500]